MKKKANKYMALAVVTAAAFTMQVQADEYRFNGTSNSLWTVGANWTNNTVGGVGVVPGAGDTARLQSNKECDLDATTTVGALNLRGHLTPGASVLNVTNGAALTGLGTSIGTSGDNRLAGGAGASTTLNIYSNSSVTFEGTGEFEMGNVATGTVNIATGGSLTVNQKLVAGKKTGGVAIINVNGGTATFNNIDAQIGSAAGTHAIITLNSGTLVSDGNLRITDNATATAELNIHGGTLIATNSSVQIRDGVATITQTDGVINAQDLYIGHLKGSTGTMNMSGGSNTVSGIVAVGNQSTTASNGAEGTLNMSGGSMTAGTLKVGNQLSTTGTLTLSGTDTYLKAQELFLGNTGTVEVVSTSLINADDGLFQIHDIYADGNSANESFALKGAVLKLRHASTSNIVEKMDALITAGVLTWTNGPVGSLASTYDKVNADLTWTNANNIVLYADTNGVNYSYMWAQSLVTYADWTSDFGLTGGDAALTANPDADEMINLLEYALGGNPTNATDVGILPTSGIVNDAGTDYFEYVYRRRTDAALRKLTYDLQNNDDLVLGAWTNEYVEVGTAVIDADFEAVTNRISTVGQSEEFTKLDITINE